MDIVSQFEVDVWLHRRHTRGKQRHAVQCLRTRRLGERDTAANHADLPLRALRDKQFGLVPLPARQGPTESGVQEIVPGTTWREQVPQIDVLTPV